MVAKNESSPPVQAPLIHYGRWPEASIDELGALLQREDRDGYGTVESVNTSLDDDEARVAQHVRRQICDWYYHFVDHYNFDREVVVVALSYYDRYMLFQQTSGELPEGDRVHLVAVAAIFLAIKIHSLSEEAGKGEEARARALGNLYYRHFEARQVAAMEMELCQTMEWKLNPPTMHQFAINFATLHPLGKRCPRFISYLYEVARYQAELVVFFPTLLAKFKPSVLAYAAILNASENLPPRLLTPDLQEKWLTLPSHPVVRMDRSEVKEARVALENMCPKLPDIRRIEHLREDTISSTSTSRRDVQTNDGRLTPTNIMCHSLFGNCY